jgi:acylphosphatase
MENARRIEVHYLGQVQGVGFRYRARTIADEYDVVGFVRNLDDGSVHVVAEGRKEDLLQFLRTVDAHMERYIRDKSVQWSKAQQQFDHFEIRR